MSKEDEKREKLLIGFFNEKINREAAKSQLNALKVSVQWQGLLRAAKTTELQTDLKLLSQTFQAQLDYKDEMMRFLRGELEDLELQYVRAISDHMLNLERLMGIQEKRVSVIRKRFTDNVVFIQSSYSQDAERAGRTHEEELSDLREISLLHRDEFETKERSQKASFFTCKDEIVEEGADERHQMRQQLELEMDQIWSKLQEAFRTYRENTRERNKAYMDFKKKDEASCLVLLQQKKKIAQTTRNIKRLKKKIFDRTEYYKEKNGNLKEEMSKVVAYTQEMKSRMKAGNERSQQDIRTLVLQASGAVSVLRDYKKLGERVIHMSECCRRLETETEQVLPFYNTELTDEELEMVQQASKMVVPRYFPKEKLEEYPTLEDFWKRFSKAALDTLAIQKEIQDLEHKNNQLKGKLGRRLAPARLDRLIKEAQTFVATRETCPPSPRLCAEICRPRMSDVSSAPMDTQTFVESLLNF